MLVAASTASGYAAVDLSPILKQMEARDFQTACAELRGLSTKPPQSVDVWNLLGVCESELHNAAAARAAFQRGLSLDPKSLSLNQNAGYFFFRQDDFEMARQCLGRAVSLGASDPEVLFNLAVAQHRTGHDPDALRNLLSLEPRLNGESFYWEERGWVELPENSSAAAGSFARALALAPDSLRALHGAASAAEAQGEEEKAVALLLHAKQVAPDDVRTLLHFGNACLQRGLTVDALAALQHAHELAPENRLALFLYARAELGMQQWQKSFDLFSDFDKRMPNYAPAQFALGWLDLKLDRPSEARVHLEKSLKLSPKQPDVLYELGQMDLDEGQLSTARERLEAALRLAPGQVKSSVALGDLEMKSGRASEARSRYESAIRTDPNDGSAHYKLSVALMRLHETDAAQRERELGAKLNADASKVNKTVLLLAGPDGKLLTGEPDAKRGND